LKTTGLLFATVFISCYAPDAWVLANETADVAIAKSDDSDVELCRSFADKAAESKTARQRNELLKLKVDIEAQLATLDQKTKSLEAWIGKRDAIRTAVSSSLVKMYTNVEPEIAAQQLQKLDAKTTAELLQRLSAKQSGEIITAMDATFASSVLKIMLIDASKMATKKETP
jgi:flagellar motility protein MotE (MotC chaperone)